MNVFVVKAVVGFEKDGDGLLNVTRPIIQDLTPSVLQTYTYILAKAHHYEMPTIGVVKDKIRGTIYNNFLYIRG